MTPEQAKKDAEAGSLRPLYLVLGEEATQIRSVVDALVAGAGLGATAAFNIDRWQAADVRGDAVVGAALTVPMMAQRRLVVVQGLEAWEKKRKAGAGSDDSDGGASLNCLADYAANPASTATVILTASKLNGSRRLVKTAKKEGFLVSCEPLSRSQLPAWIRRSAKKMGHPMTPAVAESLAELLGPKLGPVEDGLERLSLFVGPGQEIGEDVVASNIARVRQQTVWTLLDALSVRDLRGVLRALSDAVQNRGDAMSMLGLLRWRVRQLVRYRSSRSAGLQPREAAKAAGVPSFKANEIEAVARKLGTGFLEHWLMLLAEADLASKDSRRPRLEVVTTTLVAMCGGQNRAR
jgi:DNA polymerase III subunit delta